MSENGKVIPLRSSVTVQSCMAAIGTMEVACRAAFDAIDHLFERARRDPDLSFQIGPGNEAFILMCLAQAQAQGRSLETVMRERAFEMPIRDAEILILRARVAELEAKLGR